MGPNLRLLIPSLLSLTSVGALAACGPGETSMENSTKCPGTNASRYQALSLGANVDGIVFRTLNDRGAPATGAAEIKPIGEVCKGASDKAACLTKVTETVAIRGWSPYVSGNVGPAPTVYGVGTRGNDVFLIETPEALGKAVAPVTAEEAVALVFLTMDSGVVCNSANLTTTATGYDVKALGGSCGTRWESIYSVSRDGAVSKTAQRELSQASGACTEGRRPSGFVERPESGWLGTLAAHFAEIAHMEAAAVLAFDELQVRLRAYGAPEELIARARKARADEVRHAAVTAALAARFGGTFEEPVPSATQGELSLLAFAIENAMEGCVRETYGALIAGYQAEHAEDAEIRDVFAAIRDEELEHAELSWAIAEWAEERLTSFERTLVHSARACALAELRAAIAVDPCRDVRTVAGMPDGATALMLLDGLAPALSRAA